MVNTAQTNRSMDWSKLWGVSVGSMLMRVEDGGSVEKVLDACRDAKNGQSAYDYAYFSVAVYFEAAHRVEAETLFARLPKYVRARLSGLGSDGVSYPGVCFDVKLSADDARGDKNEAGLKRLQKFLDVLFVETRNLRHKGAQA